MVIRRKRGEWHSGGMVLGSGDRTMAKAMNSNNIKMRTGKTLDGFLLPFEDHRATGKMYAQVTVPSAGISTMDA